MNSNIKFEFPMASFQAEVSYQVDPDKKLIVTTHPNKSPYEEKLLSICATYYSASTPWAENLAGTITTDQESFYGVFMTAINFGTLDYTSSDEFDYEVTWRYKESVSKEDILPGHTHPTSEHNGSDE